MKNYIIALVLFSISFKGIAQEQVFDIHAHLWEGNNSLQEYLKHLDTTRQTVTRFGGILIASKGVPMETKKKNDEMIALSKQNPKLIPICSVHPLDGNTAMQELKRLGQLGVKIIKLHPHTQKFDVTGEQVFKLCQQAGALGIVVVLDRKSVV